MSSALFEASRRLTMPDIEDLGLLKSRLADQAQRVAKANTQLATQDQSAGGGVLPADYPNQYHDSTIPEALREEMSAGVAQQGSIRRTSLQQPVVEIVSKRGH